MSAVPEGTATKYKQKHKNLILNVATDFINQISLFSTGKVSLHCLDLESQARYWKTTSSRWILQ